MQIKPFFDEYIENSRVPFIEDDTGTMYDIVEYEAVHYIKINNEITQKENFSGTKVLSRKMKVWSNGAKSYEEDMYFYHQKNFRVKNTYDYPKYIIAMTWNGTTGVLGESNKIPAVIKQEDGSDFIAGYSGTPNGIRVLPVVVMK